MKKNLSKVCALLLLIGSFSACVQEETIDQPNQTQDVSFSFNIGDRGTKIEGDIPEYEGIDGCKSMEDLQALATAGKLNANITLSTEEDPEDDAAFTITLPVKNLTGGKLQTLAYALAKGKYYVHAATITSTETGDINPLFSGVKIGSKYAAYIPDGQLMTEYSFTIGDDQLFKKTPIDLWVLCASKITPEDFGFVKWNINYVRAFCIPFMVNVCKDEDGDVSGKGSVKIEYKEIDGTYTVLHQFNFDSDGAYGEFCFKDDYGRENKDELHKITLAVGSILSEKVVSLKDLLEYEKSTAWDKEKKFLHLNFCDCIEPWIFDCEAIPETKCVDELRFIEGNSNTGGSDAFLEFWVYKQDANGNFIGDGDANKYEFDDFKFDGINVLSAYDTNAGNGVFSLRKGLACRSVDAVPYALKKIMKIQLDILAKDGKMYSGLQDICRILIFDDMGVFLGSFPYMGLVDTSNANNLSFHFDKLGSDYGLVDQNGKRVDLEEDKCYRVGILTYIDAPWDIDIKQFFVRTQGN